MPTAFTSETSVALYSNDTKSPSPDAAYIRAEHFYPVEEKDWAKKARRAAYHRRIPENVTRAEFHFVSEANQIATVQAFESKRGEKQRFGDLLHETRTAGCR